jgi:hypothetical protein
MNAEEVKIPMILVGFKSGEEFATVSPPAMVVEAHSQVSFLLDGKVKGTAKVMLPTEGLVIHLTPGEATNVEVTRTGVYYAVVALNNPGKVGAMAVLICDP